MIVIDLTPDAGTHELQPVAPDTGTKNRTLRPIGAASFRPSKLKVADEKILVGGQGITFRPPGTTD